jgi:hypothetical protein
MRERTVMLRIRVLSFVLGGLLSAVALAASAETLGKEPAPGELRGGETVLVDDGSCPAGKIKQVTGGDDIHHSTGAAKPGGGRRVRCIKRP